VAQNLGGSAAALLDGLLVTHRPRPTFGRMNPRLRPGIDVNAVRSDVGFLRWHVAMDDNLVESLFMQQEVAADPKQILFALTCQRNAGLDAGMHKKAVVAHKR
jgi:hypothetical protein